MFIGRLLLTLIRIGFAFERVQFFRSKLRYDSFHRPVRLFRENDVYLFNIILTNWNCLSYTKRLLAAYNLHTIYCNFFLQNKFNLVLEAQWNLANTMQM